MDDWMNHAKEKTRLQTDIERKNNSWGAMPEPSGVVVIAGKFKGCEHCHGERLKITLHVEGLTEADVLRVVHTLTNSPRVVITANP